AKALRKEQIKAISDWRKQFCRPFSPDDIETLQFYSQKIDELWAAHSRELARDRDRTEDPLPVWGQPDDKTRQRSATPDKDHIRASGIFNLGAKTASPYRRLKLAMDYWCALWFWPIDQAHLLPDRDTFLMEIGLLLTGNVLDVSPVQSSLGFDAPAAEAEPEVAIGPAQSSLSGFDVQQPLRSTRPGTRDVTDRHGQLQIEKLFEHFPRLR
ncbi:MAG: hypothetical protein KDI51_21025, partial [Xanthomonadales bacterium]|nr:hypothetical protein [Xanthomonadales bacterium]